MDSNSSKLGNSELAKFVSELCGVLLMREVFDL